MFAVKRAYEPPAASDGYRVLVDRLWPRGLTKERAAVDEWFRDVAPSSELRSWFAHDPAKWDGFLERYAAELVERPGALDHLRDLEAEHGTVTLVYSARDAEHNQAVALLATLAENPAS